MKLLFVRHGQTDFNKNKLPQGQEIDAPLNDTGIQQAEEAAKFLPDNIDFIITSPLKRASQTAEILNKKLDKKIEFNDDIKELRYGSLAGKPWPEIEVLTGDKDAYQKDKDILFDYRKFGGDSAEDLKRRVEKFISEVKEKYPDKNILVATHGGVIDSMHILFPQKERAETDNATIHEFRFGE
jgi:broad specificity phosphatase PhoE